MRKQTKLVAVLSAAALLAIGASMTSFAATKGWAQEGDTWVYLNSSGERVTEDWKKSGANYYWLDENGEMATNKIIEDDDNYYYVNESGARVVNQWVSVENVDDETVDGKEVDTLWYYLGTSGRAYKSNDPDMYKNVLINGKRYFFDEEGHMVSGWTTTRSSDSAEHTYYLGEENEGWAYTDWQYLELPEEIEGDYDVDEAWFHFKSNGRARKSERTYIKNAYYAFDDNGVMLDDWQAATRTSVLATPDKIDLASDSNATSFYNLDSGNQGSGWVYTYEGAEESGDEKWFYLESSKYNQVFNASGKDSNGAKAWKYVEGDDYDSEKTQVAAKVIKGKTYLFDNKGAMLTGVYVLPRGVKRAGGGDLAEGIYYFNKAGGSAEGRMETGRTTINYDGETFTYYFNKGGQAARVQLNDGALYDGFGVRVEAKDGNANQLVDIATLIAHQPYKRTMTDKDGKEVSDPRHINTLKLGNKEYTQGTVIVSSTGKVRTGTVTIDDVKYEISGYVVTNAYDKSDKDLKLPERFVPAK